MPDAVHMYKSLGQGPAGSRPTFGLQTPGTFLWRDQPSLIGAVPLYVRVSPHMAGYTGEVI